MTVLGFTARPSRVAPQKVGRVNKYGYFRITIPPATVDALGGLEIGSDGKVKDLLFVTVVKVGKASKNT